MARILVVEDSPDVRALLRGLLEAADHEIFTASDGQEGVKATREKKPDLVLMDLSLPILSGGKLRGRSSPTTPPRAFR